MNYLREALTYLNMGWAVYPAHSVDEEGNCSCGRSQCPSPGKHPVGRWMDYQNRMPTEREVKLWFRDTGFNVGTVTGLISGIVVVDADGEEGIETVRKLKLAPTLTAQTGGGGYHLFYLTSEHIDSRVRAAPGIDIRGDGGYVVLAPSYHRSGNRYEWLEPRPIVEFDPTPFKRPAFSANGNGWVEEILNGVSEGSRSNSAAKLAGRYFGLGLHLEETWILMCWWNEHNNPPLELEDLRRTVRWAQRKHSENHVKEIQTVGQLKALLDYGE